ncbi:uncharacterized protein LOC113909858 isoform X3 [Zalophus californianus]|uniref:Uncharacterized protein LOC113909858 isoform X3 n=1 Tax=Zalophus californianus TaxID=9704 RepID=A0A6J2B8B9_ZALCA|nr:uncharacterized protein LOC113909858 isoform X3 [Zalophus californianus]
MKDGLLLNYHSFVGKTHFKLPAFFCPLIPSKQQFPEAMTCPCSWRPSREGPRGLLGPVLPTEEGRERLDPRSGKEPKDSKGRAPSDSTQGHSPLTQIQIPIQDHKLPIYGVPWIVVKSLWWLND